MSEIQGAYRRGWEVGAAMVIAGCASRGVSEFSRGGMGRCCCPEAYAGAVEGVCIRVAVGACESRRSDGGRKKVSDYYVMPCDGSWAGDGARPGA
jgi:hypothetical protein